MESDLGQGVPGPAEAVPARTAPVPFREVHCVVDSQTDHQHHVQRLQHLNTEYTDNACCSSALTWFVWEKLLHHDVCSERDRLTVPLPYQGKTLFFNANSLVVKYSLKTAQLNRTLCNQRMIFLSSFHGRKAFWVRVWAPFKVKHLISGSELPGSAPLRIIPSSSHPYLPASSWDESDHHDGDADEREGREEPRHEVVRRDDEDRQSDAQADDDTQEGVPDQNLHQTIK